MLYKLGEVLKQFPDTYRGNVRKDVIYHGLGFPKEGFEDVERYQMVFELWDLHKFKVKCPSSTNANMTLISGKPSVNGSIILADSKMPLCFRVAIEDSVAPRKPGSLDKVWLPAHIFFHLISAKIHEK